MGIANVTARYRHGVTNHQGFIEGLLLSGLAAAGVKVERACKPVKMALSEDVSELDDPQAYPIKVRLPDPFYSVLNSRNAARPRAHRAFLLPW